MKVLVAGGAGFIGSNLIDRLLDLKDDVVCIDNFMLGTAQNIEHLKDNPHFKMYLMDLCDLEALKEIFQAEKFDYVFHLAANSDIQKSAMMPQIEYANTYTTTFNLLECMRLFQVKKIFFASTSALYGDKSGKPVEETMPFEPISYYGAAKMGSEGLISAYSFMNDFSSLVFRFPNVIGRRLTHGVIHDFIKKLKSNPAKLEILGNGLQCKPYMLVDDLVDAILLFKDAPRGVTIYNVGVDSQTTVNRIADIICHEMNLLNVSYQYSGGVSGWKGDVPVFSYDLSRIHSQGWTAKYTSDEAVRLTVEEVLRQK